MEVILLEKIRNLGSLGDKVNVKSGYARNFLVPEGKAVFATEENIAEFEARKAELEKSAATALAEANQRAAKIAALETITLTARASEEGKLFGSIGVRDIVDAVVAKGVKMTKNEVSMPDGALHQLGEFTIDILLHSDVSSQIKINIVAEE